MNAAAIDLEVRIAFLPDRGTREAKRAGDALLRGTTPVAQDTPAEQDRIRELGLVVADVYGDLHGLDDALGCRLDCLNLTRHMCATSRLRGRVGRRRPRHAERDGGLGSSGCAAPPPRP